MNPARRRATLRLVLIALVLLAGVLLRYLLDALLGDRLPYLIALPLTLALAAQYGKGVGIVAALLSFVAADYLFVAPRYALVIDAVWLLSLGVFLIGAAWVGQIAERARASERQARQAAASADAEKRLLDAVLEALPVGVIITDRVGKVVRCNPVFREVWGEVPPNHDWHDFADWVGYWPDSGRRIQAREWAISRALLKGEVVQGELVENRRFGDAQSRRFINNAAPVRGAQGRVVGAVVATQDITEHTRIGEQLREFEARLQLFIEHAPAAIAMFDCELRYLLVSRRWRRDFAVEGEVTGQWIFAHRADEIPARWLDALRRGLAGEAQCGAEEPIRRRDGRIQYIKWELHPWHTSDGAVGGLLIAAEDVTARTEQKRELEQTRAQLHDHAQQLEALVALRTEALTDAVHELESWSYSIAHDMRAPLRAMQGFARILLEEHRDGLDATALDLLRRIHSAAHRLDRLIQDVLSYTKMARSDLDLRPVDVEALLRELISSYPAWQPPRAEIVIESPLLPVLGNAAALSQVLSNLIDNALKFVVVGTQPRVRVHTEALAAHVRLWIEDNGIGIPLDAQPRIFDMFQRVHHDGEFEGTGIGLAVVRKAVERMGGRVGVESEFGRGSRFWVQLHRPEP